MTDFERIFEQFRLFATQHVPPDLLSKAVPVAILLLIGGALLSVLGAKLARCSITLGFLAVGAVLGGLFAREADVAQVPCVAAGAAMIATIGFLTHRLWVGVAAAVVLSAVVLGVYGYEKVVPHVSSFERMVVLSPVDGGTAEFALPTPEQQAAYHDRTPDQWFQQFWSFVRQQNADIPRHGKALGLAAAVIGLFIGVAAMRFTLIVSTAVIGTALVSTGLATLIAQWRPEICGTAAQHPGIVGMAIGALLVNSLILQAILTRKAPSKPPKPAKPAKSSGKS